MERERLREPEPMAETHYEKAIRTRKAWVERQMTGNLVVHAADREFQQSRQGLLRTYLATDFDDTALNHWSVFMHNVKRQSGRHRHQGGLVIFVVEGEGVTEVDGQALEWQAGDLLLLPVKPGGVAHQHFNRDLSRGCRWIAFGYRPLQNYVAHFLTQMQETPDLRGAPTNIGEVLRGSVPAKDWKAGVVDGQIPLITHPDELAGVNLFERTMELRDLQRARREAATWMIRGDDLPWELNQHGRMQWYLHPLIAYSTIHTLVFYRQEIPVGSRSGLQRHAGDVVFFIVQGEGYTEVDGVRHAWKADDVMTLPLRPQGLAFRHVNTGSVPVQLVGCEPNFIHTIDLDRGAGWEELDPCPEYHG